MEKTFEEIRIDCLSLRAELEKERLPVEIIRMPYAWFDVVCAELGSDPTTSKPRLWNARPTWFLGMELKPWSVQRLQVETAKRFGRFAAYELD